MLWLFSAILIAVLLTACGGEPTPTPEPTPQPQTQPAAAAPAQSAAPAPTVSDSEDRRAEPQAAAPRSQEVVEEQPDAAAKQPLREAADQADAETVEPEPEPEPEEPPQDLTDAPGTVVQDADVRLRPALVWRVIDRLEVGDRAVVLQQASGWYRIRYGGGQTGWIRAPMLDLGEIATEQVLHQPAEPLIAEWQGEQYGVMGQSPDGAEVRLLGTRDEWPVFIGAPIAEVALLSEDVAASDLPILIVSETVVFPNGKFGVGEGKVLPQADQWLWLPWGWLLAHNGTHVWQWRPQTDALEFATRPPGLAVLSPDGHYLAIDNVCPRLAVLDLPIDCERGSYAIILPLDGSAPIVAPHRVEGVYWHLFPRWAPNSEAVHFELIWRVLNVDGQVVSLDDSYLFGNLNCEILPFPWVPQPYDHPWWLRYDNTLVADASCIDEHGEEQIGVLVLSLDGEFLELDVSRSPAWRRDFGAEMIRTTDRGDLLGEQLIISWSPDESRALVVDLDAAAIWIYHADRHDLEPVQLSSTDSPPSRLWEVDAPDEDWRVRPSWQDNQVAVVITGIHSVHAALLTDLDTNRGTALDLGGPGFLSFNNQPPHGWSPTGDAYYTLTSLWKRADGLAEARGPIYSVLTFDRSGRLVGAVNVVNTCGDGEFSHDLRRPRRAGWSPDGEWFAVGGQELDGVFTCAGG